MTIHKEGYRIIVTTWITLLFCALLVYWSIGNIQWLSALCYTTLLIFGLFFLFFFRKPNRELSIDEHAVIAPADGKVIKIEEIFEKEHLKEPRLKVSIFMSIFNVHMNWFPVGGTIEYCKHHNGHFHVACHPKASEKNEHTTIVVKQNNQKILFRQIAGYIARRIVCYAKVDKEVHQCTQAGFIKFGSRVDLLLPLEYQIKVEVGQKVKGGQTIIAQNI